MIVSFSKLLYSFELFIAVALHLFTMFHTFSSSTFLTGLLFG